MRQSTIKTLKGENSKFIFDSKLPILEQFKEQGYYVIMVIEGKNPILTLKKKYVLIHWLYFEKLRCEGKGVPDVSLLLLRRIAIGDLK